MNDKTPQDLLSVTEVGDLIGKRKQTVFKVLKRLQIKPQKRRASEKHGQVQSYITRDELERVRAELGEGTMAASTSSEQWPTETGVFYLIQLEPEHDPGRFKVGFTSNMGERLRSHRTSAPYAVVVRTWPCRLLWEKTLIDCLADECERLHTEVFRTDSLEEVIAKCEAFFDLMPEVGAQEMVSGSGPSSGEGVSLHRQED